MSRLNFSVIFKRSSCLNSTESKTDSEKIFNLLENNQLKSIKEQHKMSVASKNGINNYFNSLSNKENASQYWYRGLDIIHRLNENGCRYDANKLVDKYNSSILPYVENIEEVMESLDNYNLTDQQYEKIKDLCEDFKFADKIVNNHNQISKRFNIEFEVKSARIKGLDNVVESCCSMIDTYSYEPYQKLNIAIDEMSYLLEKNNIDYRQDELLSSILEYFLLRSSQLTDRDIKGYKFVMNNNKCIDDVSPFKFLFENFKVINIRSAINDYLKIQDKTTAATTKEFVDIINNTSVEDLRNNTNLLIEFLYKLYTSQTCADCGTQEMLKSISEIFEAIGNRFEKESMIDSNTITRDDIESLIFDINKYISKINVIDPDDSLATNKIEFKNTIKAILLSKLIELSNSVYSKDNIKSLDFVNNTNIETVPLKEYRIFKYNEIIKSTNNFDNYLKSRMKNIYNESNPNIKLSGKDIKNIIYSEGLSIDRDSIYSFIGNDNKVDICLCQIELNSEEQISTMLNELSTLCKDFNNELKINRIDNIKSYYLINGCIAEIHLKDATNIVLTEEEMEIANESYKPEFDVYINQLGLFEACNEIAENFTNKSLEEVVASIFTENKEYTIEAYDVMMEALSFLNPERYIIDNLTESFSQYRNSILTETAEMITENRYIKSIYNNWKPVENVSYDVQIEAYNILNMVIQEAVPKISKPKVGAASINKNKSSNNKDNKDEYSPSSSISNKINNLKIMLKGLGSKIKDFGRKEKELSKTFDAYANNFIKSIKDASMSDKREQIIKGKVIPSFSKSIKTAIALAGVGIITQNPIIPLVAIIGGLITSKKISDKERMLLLDEIETELEVLEKEIAMADSKNQIKKYRTLLQYKKNLQRQYQRIKYNIKVGTGVLPNSSVGAPKND